MAHHKSADPNKFILPDLGEGVHEAELLKWRVSVGQTVAEHDILADMETDKAVVEVPSPRAGTIAELHGKEGEILKVGNVLVSYVGSASAQPAAAPAPAPTQAKKASPKPEPTSNASSNGTAEEPREDAGTVVGNMQGAAAGVSAQPGKALATPAVRRLARDLGVDIDRVVGTGIGGRVTEKDVRAAGSGHASAPAPVAAPVHTPAPAPRAHAPAPAPSPAPAPRRDPMPAGESTQRVPFRGVRRTIANRLRESVNRAVHFTVMDEADVAALDSMRRKLASASGEKVSFLPFVCAAVCRVLSQAEFRPLNAQVDEKPEDPNYDASIIQHRSVHLGIATDTENGLMVPVIRDAHAMGVLEISRTVASLADQARARSISRESLMGSTFTISNVGSHAGRFATPIINYPEVGILAVGRARDGVVVRHGGIFATKLLPLSLACDHRVVDGATAALALAKIVELLQTPDALL
ncbi:MAG: dihydrolipoamide acetyltransferase family protein [Planctomycetota bacterium]|nr:dihydrolipoamide acetyltransferase family protein [Planctomycetota bacterium]